METGLAESAQLVVSTLLDLPMRDGNSSAPVQYAPVRCPFRPSYEGWKPKLTEKARQMGRLLDLPMRDGNSPVRSPPQRISRLLDLPMRDGNMLTVMFSSFRRALLDLPMRDGNHTRVSQHGHRRCAFRPSYEGWKRDFKIHTAARIGDF